MGEKFCRADAALGRCLPALSLFIYDAALPCRRIFSFTVPKREREMPRLADSFHQIDVLSGAIQINPAISFYLVRSRGDLAYSSRFSFLLRAARA